jgi:hypothetical protein
MGTLRSLASNQIWDSSVREDNAQPQRQRDRGSGVVGLELLRRVEVLAQYQPVGFLPMILL